MFGEKWQLPSEPMRTTRKARKAAVTFLQTSIAASGSQPPGPGVRALLPITYPTAASRPLRAASGTHAHLGPGQEGVRGPCDRQVIVISSGKLETKRKPRG